MDVIMKFPRLEDVELAGKTVLLRTDLNVPMQGGIVTDNTRILRLLPTLNYLLRKKCRIVLLSHFDRPGGRFVPSLSLAPLVDAVSLALGGKKVQFGVDCVGPAARDAVDKLKPGEIVLLENLRFHPEEEKGDSHFARELASLGEVFINDAFSASHRAHASITGIAHYLPVAAGRLMEKEIEALDGIFSNPKKPITAIIGGAKISTKLELLENLINKVDNLIIGGAMANTFLLAQGHSIGVSLVETKLKQTADRILKKAQKEGCNIILPIDVLVREPIEPSIEIQYHVNTPPVITTGTSAANVSNIPPKETIYDIGNKTLRLIADCLGKSKTVIWNGPMGMFERNPYDVATLFIAREIASLTLENKIKSIAGGGDTVAAITRADMAHTFTYISTAGGAFLEWLEGKTLPGVAALMNAKPGGGSRSKAHG